ncbi:MAG TPA: hypothetical protein VK168_20040 [Saprospiraceae bacterium]|nr:hypothetical protein [Saprospiraceae bacterium]
MEKQRVSVNEYALQVCNSQDDLMEIARLRYHAYRSVDAIRENPDGLFTDNYDFQQNTKSCMVYEENQLVSSIRACVYSPTLNYNHIPAFEVYKDDIKEALGLDKVIVESNRFVISHDKAESKSLFKIPFRFIVLNLNKFDGDYVITAVREKHVPLYRRFLTMEPISQPKRYPGLDVDMVLLAGDVKNGIEALVRREEIYAIPQEEVASYWSMG